ncbi:hypothetical protein GOODEAATRI_027978 [Goodea atripinnis]|uniref:Secreted protein n=1 Tax=Goodea atripinnis TaxID=208336 RepID=A0ABV0PSE0_9TELE
MTVRLIGHSKLPLSVCLVVCVLPCDGLATCPGCTLPLAHRQLEMGTNSPATHYGISVKKCLIELNVLACFPGFSGLCALCPLSGAGVQLRVSASVKQRRRSVFSSSFCQVWP